MHSISLHKAAKTCEFSIDGEVTFQGNIAHVERKATLSASYTITSKVLAIRVVSRESQTPTKK